MWTDPLFEPPWLITGVLSAAAFGLVVHGWRRADKRQLKAAGAVVAVIAAWWIVASLVETSRERLTRLTNSLIHATSPYDAAAFRTSLSPTVTLTSPDPQRSVWLSGPEVFATIDRSMQVWQPESHRVHVDQLQMKESRLAAVDLSITTLLRSEFGVRPIRSKWRFIWERDSAGLWKVAEIQWRELNGQPPRRGLWD